jgi:hydrocephalus-inducing protein
MGQPMPNRTTLQLVNNDNSAISIESMFEKKPYLDVQLAPGQVLLPSTKDKKEMLEVPIIFTPREIRKYSEVVQLDFNGIYKIDFTIKGEGIPMNVELQDPDQHTIDFGIQPIGADVCKTVNLLNKSKKTVQFSLKPENESEFKKNSLTLNYEEGKIISLKPKSVLPIEVSFNPKNRMVNFWHDIMI